VPKLGMGPVRREQISRAAARVISQRGLDRTTLQKVADVARVSTGTVNHYFGNKMGLLADTLTYVAEQWQEELNEALRNEPPGVDQLRALIRMSVSFTPDNVPWRVWLAAWSEATRSAEIRAVIEEHRDVLQRTIRDVLHGMDTLHTASDDVLDELANEFNAYLNGLGLHIVTRGKYLDPRAVEETVVVTALGRLGIAAPLDGQVGAVKPV
jgi:TetR/AcrR family transcriptional repressor of bet genes